MSPVSTTSITGVMSIQNWWLFSQLYLETCFDLPTWKLYISITVGPREIGQLGVCSEKKVRLNSLHFNFAKHSRTWITRIWNAREFNTFYSKEYKATFHLIQNVHGSVYVRKLGIVIFLYLDWQKSNTGSVHQIWEVKKKIRLFSFLSWKLFQFISLTMKSLGSAWTRIAGFKVQSANHYTTEPCTFQRDESLPHTP